MLSNKFIKIVIKTNCKEYFIKQDDEFSKFNFLSYPINLSNKIGTDAELNFYWDSTYWDKIKIKNKTFWWELEVLLNIEDLNIDYKEWITLIASSRSNWEKIDSSEITIFAIDVEGWISAKYTLSSDNILLLSEFEMLDEWNYSIDDNICYYSLSYNDKNDYEWRFEDFKEIWIELVPWVHFVWK